MAESFVDKDLATLRAIAYAAGIPGCERMSHDELVTALRRAGLSEPTGGPIDTSLADPGDPGTDEGIYHGQGVGRRESSGGPAAQTAAPRPGPPGPGRPAIGR
ncbi:hypothetical protein [Micromonospora sp. CB01531]|uniref:hypothetical protein n=1 Tax=Micromonospora sp. CB01531 TaxID=1718947 RepID=UPI00093D6EE5|nr:hypothetical protein [Micromonospora sp. CB01531]OKI85100.1 hypothetical protein A6A27_14950 [Micromonospora sp. CB01531]